MYLYGCEPVCPCITVGVEERPLGHRPHRAIRHTAVHLPHTMHPYPTEKGPRVTVSLLKARVAYHHQPCEFWAVHAVILLQGQACRVQHPLCRCGMQQERQQKQTVPCRTATCTCSKCTSERESKAGEDAAQCKLQSPFYTFSLVSPTSISGANATLMPQVQQYFLQPP